MPVIDQILIMYVFTAQKKNDLIFLLECFSHFPNGVLSIVVIANRAQTTAKKVLKQNDSEQDSSIETILVEPKLHEVCFVDCDLF